MKQFPQKTEKNYICWENKTSLLKEIPRLNQVNLSKKLTGKNVGYEVGKVRFPFIDKQISDRIFNVKYFHF